MMRNFKRSKNHKLIIVGFQLNAVGWQIKKGLDFWQSPTIHAFIHDAKLQKMKKSQTHYSWFSIKCSRLVYQKGLGFLTKSYNSCMFSKIFLMTLHILVGQVSLWSR